MFDHRDGISQRQAAKKFGSDKTFVSKTLKMQKVQCIENVERNEKN